MPKMKTRRAAAKRFSFTAKGKVKRHHAFGAHIKTKKSAKRIRGLRKSDLVAAVDVPRVKRMLNA